MLKSAGTALFPEAHHDQWATTAFTRNMERASTANGCQEMQITALRSTAFLVQHDNVNDEAIMCTLFRYHIRIVHGAYIAEHHNAAVH